ncbi:MAG: biotin--[acetyl-CoA-carboxylase] ligase [Bdellovibrionales bacterium]|nr:biotin--[acetyl-CoA-carboxylase] ligase [Bdellovibrionales bacterium]
MSTEKIVETTESTQSDLRALLAQDQYLPHLSYIQARQQTQGRGRGDRKWISDPGNLHISILYRFGEQEGDISKNVTWIPLWVGMRIRAALVALGFLDKDVDVKWPNDLMFQSQFKFGGVLCEKIQQNILIGIGMNITAAPQAELATEGRKVTSLAEMSSKHQLDADGVRNAIVKELKRKFDMKALRNELAAHMLPKTGSEITWIEQARGNAENKGVVTGLGGFGELLVSNSNGEHQLFSEEVRLVLKQSKQ